MPKFTRHTMRKSCSCRGRCECFANIAAEIKSMNTMVDAFAEEMKNKLKKKYLDGWTGWDDIEFNDSIAARLRDKSLDHTGQEIDIANLAAMLWNFRQHN